MEGALSLIGLAFAALLAVAIAVAWWEQTGQETRAAAPPAQPVLVVDLHLDHLVDLPDRRDAPGAATPLTGDQVARDAVLGQAMARMTQSPASSIAWMETQPMVASGQRADPVPSAWG